MVGRIPVVDVTPGRRPAGACPAKAVVGEPFPVSRHGVPRGPRRGRRERRARATRRRASARRCRMAPGAPGTDRWRRRRSSPTTEGAGPSRSRRGATRSRTWQHDADDQDRRPGVGRRADARAEGALLLERRRRRRAPGGPTRPQARRGAATALRDTVAAVAARLAARSQPDARRGPGRATRCANWSPPRAATRCWVDRERALYGSWYEFFPRSEGATCDDDDRRRPSRHVHAPPPSACRLRRRDGLRRRLPAADPPDRRGQPQGPEQHPRSRRPDDVGSPWAIGSHGRRPRRHPPGAGHDGRLRRLRAPGPASSAWRSRSTSRCRPRPTTRGSTEHPEWFTTRPTAPSPTPRTRRRSTRTSTRSTSTTTPRASTPSACGSCGYWIEPGVRIFRVDNPHTKPVDFWEWLIAEVTQTDPDVLFLAEAFTRPAMMHDARQGRLPPVLHLLHLAQRASASSRSTSPSCRRDRRTTCGRTSSSTPRTSCTPTCSTAGRPAFTIRAVLAAMLLADLGRLLRLRAVRARRRAAGQRGVPRLARSTSCGPRDCAGGRARGPLAGAVPRHGSTRSAASTRRCSGCATCASTHVDNDARHRASARRDRRDDRRDDLVLVVVNLDPHGARETDRAPRPAGARPGLGRRLHRARRADRRRPTQWGQHNYVRLDPHREPGARADASTTDARDGRDRATTRRRGTPPRARIAFATRPSTDPDWFKRAVFYEVLVRGVRRLQRRRHRRPARADREARLPAVARRRLPVAAAVLPLAAARRRLRRQRLHRRAARVRHDRRLHRASSTRPTRAASG